MRACAFACLQACLCVCACVPYMSHLVHRALGDTKATRSACERLLERKILSLPFWEEVPRKIEWGRSQCVRVHHRVEACAYACVCLYRKGGGAPAIVSVVVPISNSNNTHVSIVTVSGQ